MGADARTQAGCQGDVVFIFRPATERAPHAWLHDRRGPEKLPDRRHHNDNVQRRRSAKHAGNHDVVFCEAENNVMASVVTHCCTSPHRPSWELTPHFHGLLTGKAPAGYPIRLQTTPF